MLICQFLVGILGTAISSGNSSAVSAEIAFICIGIAFFASTWGPGAWVLIGEIFPLPIRSRGIGLSTASNWFWNTVSLSHVPRVRNVLTVLDHCRHHAIPGRSRSWRCQPRRQGLLPLGISLHLLLVLRVLPCPRDQRSQLGAD